MGAIKERLKIVATYVDDKEKMMNQLEHAGETIEFEFAKLQDELGKQTDNILETLGVVKSLRPRIKRVEEQIKCVNALIPPDTLKQEEEPLSKDKPEFQIGDTIAPCDEDGSLRIVLEVKQNSMELMYVPSGIRYTTCSPELYKLVYRPESPKPEPTVPKDIPTDKDGKFKYIYYACVGEECQKAEEPFGFIIACHDPQDTIKSWCPVCHNYLIFKGDLKKTLPTDKHDKPEGGLKGGDVISSEDDGTTDYGIYHSTDKKRTWAYWQTGGKHFIKKLSFTTQPVTFEFRPHRSLREDR